MHLKKCQVYTGRRLLDWLQDEDYRGVGQGYYLLRKKHWQDSLFLWWALLSPSQSGEGEHQTCTLYYPNIVCTVLVITWDYNSNNSLTQPQPLLVALWHKWTVLAQPADFPKTSQRSTNTDKKEPASACLVVFAKQPQTQHKWWSVSTFIVISIRCFQAWHMWQLDLA